MFVGSPGPTHWFIKISPGIWKQVCWFLLQVEEMYMVSKEVNNMRPYLLCLICLCYHVTCVTTSEFFKTAAILALAAHWENWKRLTFNNNFSPKSPPSTAFNKVYFITNMVINYTWTPRKSSRAHNYKNADDNRDEDTENVTNTEYQK